MASFLIIFLFVAINSALALEVQLPGLGTNPTLPQYVSFFFSWLIGIAGVLSLISFTIGAVGLINPNVEAHGEAKSRMISAVLGLVLTMASFIIINTINSNIINIQLTPLESVPGVFLTDGTEKKPCPSEVSDTLTLEGFTTIKYDCPTGSAGSPLLVWQFPQAGLEGENGDLSSVIVAEVPCGGPSPPPWPWRSISCSTNQAQSTTPRGPSWSPLSMSFRPPSAQRSSPQCRRR